jgi:DNA polymerase-3 subunit gamma/tau
MLTKEASAALLKTLEEPPDHVVFVLATTDPHKVLPTIRSRTQHYEFHLLGAEDLAEHVQWVIHDAGLDLPPEAVDHVIRAGGGSARDTLSALERVAAAGGVVEEGTELGDLLDAVAGADTGRALVAVAEAMAAGRDPRVLGEALLERLRDVFLLRMGVPPAHLSPNDLARVTAWADQIGDRATTRALEAVGDALLEMRQAPDPRIPLEVALVKLTRADADASIDGLAARVAALEAALASGSRPGPAPTAAEAPAAGTSSEPAPSQPARSGPAASPTPQDPPPTGRSASSPAAEARARLAQQRASGRGTERPSPRPAPTTSPARTASPAPTPSPAPAPSPPPAPVAEPVPSTEEVEPVPQRAPVVAAVAVVSEPAGAGDLSELWSERVVASLSGLTKAMYQSTALVALEGSSATIAVDNDHHRDNCERKRPDVERVLSEAVGRSVTVRFEVGGQPATSSDPGPAPSRGGRDAPTAAMSDDPDEHLAGYDVHELPDAPDAPTGGIAALTDAFPGAEMIEEE